MGFFSKLKSVLSKTRDGISKKLNDLFAKDKLGEEFYEQLEDILISSDVSVNTTMEIVKPVGFGNDNFVAFVQKSVTSVENGMLCAVGNDDLRRFVFQTIVFKEFFANRLTQGQ